MKKTERVISLLLAIILLLTGVPVGGFGMVSEARRQDAYGDAQTRLLAEGSAKALPSLTQRLLPAGAPKTGTEDSALSGSESQTIVTGSDITSTSSVSGEQNGEALPSSAKTEQAVETTGQESQAQSQEEKDAQTLEAVRREMEKNPLTGGKALPIQDVELNGTKSLARVNYIVNRDTDGIPSSISWVLTYFAPKEKTVHQAFVVANGDNLDQPVIGNRTYAPGEEAAMKAREAARNRQTDKAPLFLYDIETKEANKDGFFLTTITTPIHRDEAMVAKINAAKAAKSIDKKTLGDVTKELEGRVYTLDMISVFGEQKITKRIQVNGKADLTATDENTTPVTHVFPQKQQQENSQQEQEKRVLFVAPNQDKKETAYQAPTFNATETKEKEQAQILVYDFVLSQDGFYDFKAVNQRSLAQYEKQLTEIEEKGLTGEALQNARKAATLSIQPGQFAITMVSEVVKVEEKTTASEAPTPPTETKPSENAAPSTTEEEAEEKNTASAANATDENAERAPSRIDEKAANEAEEAAAKTAELLPLGKTLAENASLRETLEEGKITNLLQPMGAPLNPYTTKRPIIVEVVDRDNKGVKIPGAVVRIAGPTMVKELTTNEDGQAILYHCNAGVYEVVQVSAPEGYLTNQSKITFTFSAIETVKYVRIEDAKDLGKKLFYIEGTVVDAADVLPADLGNEQKVAQAHKIANVELKLQAYENDADVAANKPLEEWTAYTDAEGHYIFNNLRPEYIYRVVVQRAPYAYVFNQDPAHPTHVSRLIRFRENGQPIVIEGGTKYKDTVNISLEKNANQESVVTIFNHELGDQTVRLAGSTFRILNAQGEAIHSIGLLTTNEEGRIEVTLRPGSYTIEQVSTDSKHRIPKALTPIQVEEGRHDSADDIHWIPNRLKDIHSVTVNREAVIRWGDVPEDPNFKLHLKRNGEVTNKPYVQRGPIYSFEGLDKYDENHEQNNYQIVLEETDEYYATYEIIDGVVNVHVHKKMNSEGSGGLVTVTGNKIWYNDSEDMQNRPERVHVMLLKNGQETPYMATVSAATNWKYRFTNLPELDENKQKIIYTVKEVDLSQAQSFPSYRVDPTRLKHNIINTRIDQTRVFGSFDLVKLDDQNHPLEGAQFTLSGYLENGQALSPDRVLKTGKDGKLTFQEIPAGVYTLRETSAPDRFEPSTETWQVEVAGDGTTTLIGSHVTKGSKTSLPDDLQPDEAYVKDAPGGQERTEENRKAKNPVPFRKTLTSQTGAGDKNGEVGDISKRILNTIDKNLNKYQMELTVRGRGRSVFGSGEATDIVLVVDHSKSVSDSGNNDSVRAQVRNIVEAFEGFTNVHMGYVEYSGFSIDKDKNAAERNNNFGDYSPNLNRYEVNPAFPNGHDPAVRRSVELTSPTDLKNHANFNTNDFDGGTFTQRALLRAQEILDKEGSNHKKHIILITDGGPTVAFKATGTKPNGNWPGIYKPKNELVAHNNEVPNSKQTYQGRASGFDTNTLRGDGVYYQFLTGKSSLGFNRLAYSSYRAGTETILDSVFATVSTVRDLTDKGTNITTIGYNLKTENNLGAFNRQEQYIFPQLASTPENYSGFGSVGNKDNVVTDIYNEVSKQYYLSQQKKAAGTIKDATIIDPMGADVDFYLGEDGVFNEKDYVLVASDGSIYENGQAPASGLLSGTQLHFDKNTQTIQIDHLNLKADESVSLYYSVRLKEGARDGNYRATNKTTLLKNQGEEYTFPIPAIRDRHQAPLVTVTNQPYQATGRFRIKKVDMKGQPLAGAYFILKDSQNRETRLQPSDKEGWVAVNNLAPGTYTLWEDEAPAGYEVSPKRWTIKVLNTGETRIEPISKQPAQGQSADDLSLETMTSGLSFAPMMGFAAVGASYGSGSGDHQIDASVVFNDSDVENKFFKVSHEVAGQSPKDRLDLYFLVVPENQVDVNEFNGRINSYSNFLKDKGYKGRINVVYAGYDANSSRYTSWDLSSSPKLLTDVPKGEGANGAYMDRALAYTNALLESRRGENAVKLVTMISNSRDFSAEDTYARNLQHMANLGLVDQYVSLVKDYYRVSDLRKYLNDSRNPMSPEAKQKVLKKLQSLYYNDAPPLKFKEIVDQVFQAQQAGQVIRDQSLEIPLGANIHLMPGTATAQVVDQHGKLLRTVKVSEQTLNGLTTLTTLKTAPLTLVAGETLKMSYQVTLKDSYKRAISYPVYVANSVKWNGTDGSQTTADIEPLYISDPGQELKIQVEGLDGYTKPVSVKVQTPRTTYAPISLTNQDAAGLTILTFDQNGKTQGPNEITVTASKPDDTTYRLKRIDKTSHYPLIQVLYERQTMKLTVRKVFNNCTPKKLPVQVTLQALVNGQDVWSSLTGMGSATKDLAFVKEGVYETVIENLPLTYNGQPISYEVKEEDVNTKNGDITIRREKTVTNYQPEEDLIRVEETELPILTVKNKKNEIHFRKVGESGPQRDANGNLIYDNEGNPKRANLPLPGTVFELRRRTATGLDLVKGYEHVTAGPDGQFSFTDLAPGDYELFETKPLLGYELPVQAVATFTIGPDGKPVEGTVKAFKERTGQDGDYILGTKRTLRNNVEVETAITQAELTDHNQGQRKMLFTQRVYLNRQGESMVLANLKLASAAADNPILNGSYVIYKIAQNDPKPAELDFNAPLDKTKYPLVEVGRGKAPADLSKISISGPSTDFYIVEVKGELAFHDTKFSSLLNVYATATENQAHNPRHDTDSNQYRNSDRIEINTGYRKGATKGEEVDIMVPATKDGDAYQIKNYRGSTYFSVQKTIAGTDPKVPLAGASFKLWAALGRNFEIVTKEQTTQYNVNASSVTDQNGIVTFENLPVNYNFYLEETKTSPGFALPDYMWLVQVRPISYLETLQNASTDWHTYQTGGKTEAEARKEANNVAYQKMLYPYDPKNRAEDAAARDQGFKVFIYQTDGRKPLIVDRLDATGQPLAASAPEVLDGDQDVIAKQSYGQHPKIPGMWYRKGWVSFTDPKPKDEQGQEMQGQMMPINEYGQPIHESWKKDGWKGETLDGVSGATIRPLIVKDWIQEARAIEKDTSDTRDYVTTPEYQSRVADFQKNRIYKMITGKAATFDNKKIASLYGITNKRTEFFINKVDENGDPLTGATFTLYKLVNGKLVEVTQSPKVIKNHTIFENLEDGTYILRETGVPAGYEEPTTQYRIVIEGGALKSKAEEAWPGKTAHSTAHMGPGIETLGMSRAGAQPPLALSSNLYQAKWALPAFSLARPEGLQALAQGLRPLTVSPKRSLVPLRAGEVYHEVHWHTDDLGSWKSVSYQKGTALGELKDKGILDQNYCKQQEGQGLVFTGWADRSGKKVTPSTSVNGNLDLYPVWERPSTQNYTVTFLDENDQKVLSQIVPEGQSYNSQFTSLPEPSDQGPIYTRPGYKLDGWYVDHYDDTYGWRKIRYDGSEPVTNNVLLYPNWVPLPASSVVTFQMIDEASRPVGRPKYRTVPTGSVLTDIPNSDPMSKEGYTFSKWSQYGANRWYRVDFSQPIYGNMTVYGYWILNTYTVTFENQGTTYGTPQQVSHGEYAVAPAPPTKDQYRFTGWKEKGGTDFFDPAQPVTKTVTYEAQWEKVESDQVVVTFDSAGGSPVEAQTLTKGQKLTEPSAPTRDGYEFQGWLLEGQPYTFDRPATQSMVLTASWKKEIAKDEGGQLTIVNKKKAFEGAFTLNKYQKIEEGRAQLEAYFTLVKHPDADRPASFDPENYARTYDKTWVQYDKNKGEKAFKTGKDGKIFFDHLQPGVYILQEKQPPAGYLRDTSKYVIVVNDIGNTIIVPWNSYDAKKYPIEVDQGEEPGNKPDKPERRTDPKLLDGEIRLTNYHLRPSVEDGIVRPLQDQKLQMEYTIHLPEDVIAGDTFTIKIDDRLNFHGLTVPHNLPAPPITTENGEVVAKPLNTVIDEKGQSIRQITYELTDYVTNRANIVIKQKMPLFIDPNQVTDNNMPVKAENTIAGNPVIADTFVVLYDPYYGSTAIYNPYGIRLNNIQQRAQDNIGGRFYDNETTNPRKGTITAYYYVFGTNCSKSSKYELTLEAKGMNGEASDVDFSDPTKIQAEIYQVPAFRSNGSLNTAAMPPSYGPEVMDLSAKPKKVTPSKDIYGRIKVPLFQVGSPGIYQYGYIVKITAPYAAEEHSKEVNLYTKATLYTETTFSNGEGYRAETYTNGVYFVNYLHRYVSSSEISSENRFTLQLTKRGLTGKDGEKPSTAPVLEGAGFQLTNNEGFEDYIVTDEKGQLTFKNLKPGSYFLKEVVTPKGYTPVSTVWDLTIDEKGNVSVSNGDSKQIKGEGKALTVWNSKTPITQPVLDFPNLPNQIRFTKQNEQGVHLLGAVFTLKKFDKPASDSSRAEQTVSEEDKERTTKEDGILAWEALSPGYYEVWEKQAPTGYVKPSQAVATFEVDKNTGKIVNLKIQGRDPVGENIIYNHRPMKIELLKIDEKQQPIGTGKVVFRLEAVNKNTPAVPKASEFITLDLTTGGPYLVEIPDNLNGEYVLSEATPPNGYIMTTNRYHIVIDRTNRTVQLTKVTNEQGIEIPYLDQGLLSKKPIDLYTDKMVDQVKLQVENHLLYTLPTTAGPGTFLFTLAGAFLLGLAFSLFRQTKGPSGRPRKRLPFLRRQLE